MGGCSLRVALVVLFVLVILFFVAIVRFVLVVWLFSHEDIGNYRATRWVCVEVF